MGPEVGRKPRIYRGSVREPNVSRSEFVTSGHVWAQKDRIFMYFSTAKKTGLENLFFVKKMGHMTKKCPKAPLSPPIVGQFFFPVVPKFTPRQSDRKAVQQAGAHNFHDIWAFGGPNLVKNSQKSALRPSKKRPFFLNGHPAQLQLF